MKEDILEFIEENMESVSDGYKEQLQKFLDDQKEKEAA